MCSLFFIPILAIGQQYKIEQNIGLMKCKCSIMLLHFIRGNTVLLILKQSSGIEIHHNLNNSTCDL